MSEVQGQSEGVSFLRRVIEAKLTSPLLLVGPDGTGRRYAVTQAAKEAFSADGSDAHELQIDRGIHPDFMILSSQDDRDIGVDAARELVTLARTYPLMATRRYIVIDGADRLTVAAANALLKVLEEPLRTTQFFLLATEYPKVLPTIRSRCGLVRFRPLPETFVAQQLSKLTSDHTKALVCSRLAEGSLGRAIQFLGSGRLTLRDSVIGLFRQAQSGDLSSLFYAIDQFDQPSLAIHFLEHLLHDLMLLPYNADKLTNLDKLEELRILRGNTPAATIDKLSRQIQSIRVSSEQTKINLGFHLKSAFATAFSK